MFSKFPQVLRGAPLFRLEVEWIYCTQVAEWSNQFPFFLLNHIVSSVRVTSLVPLGFQIIHAEATYYQHDAKSGVAARIGGIGWTGMWQIMNLFFSLA